MSPEADYIEQHKRALNDLKEIEVTRAKVKALSLEKDQIMARFRLFQYFDHVVMNSASDAVRIQRALDMARLGMICAEVKAMCWRWGPE